MRVFVGLGSCGIAAGADKVFNVLKQAGVSVEITGCLGPCYLEPIVSMLGDNGQYTDYVRVEEKGAVEIAKYVLTQENSASAYLMADADMRILNKYPRIALKNCGRINPESIENYIAAGGYYNHNESPDGIIDELKISGLRGRGGAGFPAYIKWQALKDASGSQKKYIIVNADEGDPGAFMDRAILEGDPHSILEGMLYAAKATGALEGIIYVRAEYPLAIERLKIAIRQAQEKGLLDNFAIRVKEGAGAFVCGEETALIASLEGERGMPKLKPPFPVERGYKNAPSLINNVETFANIPHIMRYGGVAFSNIGTENSKGNKVFALTGKVANGGLIEVPMGTTLRECIFELGGGIKGGKNFKAVQLGGPSGGALGEDLLDTPIDYAQLAATGAIMGSGGMVVVDDSTCMVDMARFFLDFTAKESCGKCVSCRIGTKRLLEMLERIVEGNGTTGDIKKLTELSENIKDGALCGLGQTAPNPVLSTLKYFGEEYTHHIENKKCNAKACKALKSYSILNDACIGCTLCALKCPAKAITGERGKLHVIDSAKCTKCALCVSLCSKKAVMVE